MSSLVLSSFYNLSKLVLVLNLPRKKPVIINTILLMNIFVLSHKKKLLKQWKNMFTIELISRLTEYNTVFIIPPKIYFTYLQCFVLSRMVLYIFYLPHYNFSFTNHIIKVLFLIKVLGCLGCDSWSWSYGSWNYNNQCLLPLKFWVQILFMTRYTRYNFMWSSLSVT